MLPLALLVPSALAQVACGDILTTDVTLTADVICPVAFVGDAITLDADNITLDGAGFAIVSDSADAIVRASGVDEVLIQNLVVSGTAGTGIGIELRNTVHAQVLNVIADNRAYGVYANGTNTDLNILDTDVSDATAWGMYLTNVDDGLTMARNVFDGSKEGLRLSGLAGPWTFPHGAGIDSSFVGVAEGGNADDVIFLNAVTDVTLQGLDLSSSSALGRGIYVSSSKDVTLTGNDVSGRRNGISVGGSTNTNFDIQGNDASSSGSFGIQLLGMVLPLILETNTLDGSDQGIRIDDLVGPWDLPGTNSFVNVPGSNGDDVWDLEDVTDIQIGVNLGSSTGLGNALRLVRTTDVTIDGAFVSGFYRGVYASGATTGLTILDSSFTDMTLRGLQLKEIDATTVMTDVKLIDSANGVLLDTLVGPQTYDFASFDFTGVGLGATNREYVEVLDSNDITVMNITGVDLDNDVRTVAVVGSTNVVVDGLQTCEARRGVDVRDSIGTLIQNSGFGSGTDGVVVDAASSDTVVTAAFLGNTGTDVVDNGVNTTINPSAMSDVDNDGVADLCDDCPDDGFDDLDGDGLCADIDDDDDGDGVLDGDDSDPNDPNACNDVDNDTCDDCAVAMMSDPGNDGTDTDGDGACDLGDTDDDNDTVDDGSDSSPLDPNVCSDTDLDGCDDCSTGTFDVINDGADTDGDGVCDPKDLAIDPAVSFDTDDVPWTTGGIGSPSVAFDNASGLFVMVFETQIGTHADCPVGVWGIGLATSADGKTWTDAGGPLVQPAPGSGLYWDCVAAHPTLVDRSSGNLTMFFKAEQSDTACDSGTPTWGCDQYTGIGRLALSWNSGLGEYLATVPHPVPVLAVGQNFGYPRAVFADGEYKVALSQRPDMMVASGTATNLGIDATAWSPGDAPWTPDEVYNAAPACEVDGTFTAFVGGRQLTGYTIDAGNVGRLASTNFVTWNLGPGPLFSTMVGDVEMRHWDVLPVGTTDYLLYFSDQTGPGGTNRVGLAQTAAGWSTASVQSKVCP